MGKKWRKPVMELITRDELEDLIVAAGCSKYVEICVSFH